MMKSFFSSVFFLLLCLGGVQVAKGQSSGTCDESRCRAERIHPWVDDDTEYTCWVKAPALVQDPNATAAEIADAMSTFEKDLLYVPLGYCADGFVGRLVGGVPPKEVDGELRWWYTCCPPDEGYEVLSKQVYQTCVDTACNSPDWEGGGNCWADGFQEPMTCGDSVYRYPRFTGLQSLIYVQFICCESPQVDDAFMDDLLVARSVWITLSSITLLTCTLFIIALCKDKQVRSNGYNLYLIFLAIPDALANFVILLRNALAMSGLPVSPTVFIFVASFEYFYAIANIWLNAIIVGTIHHVLRQSMKDKSSPVPPPPVQKVYKQTAVVYAFSVIIFGWAFFLYMHGLSAFSLDDIMTVWITTRCIVVGPPILFVMWVCFDVWWNDRLPISGRTRVLALYFMRVIVVFLVTWVPYFILYEVAWNVTHDRWMVYISYYLGSIQGTLSVMVALSKPDVKIAFWDFLYGLCSCSCSKPIDDKADNSRHSRAVGDRDGDLDGQTADLQDEPEPLDDEEETKPATRFFGRTTKADAMWEEDDFWGTEEDILEKIMAGGFDESDQCEEPGVTPPQKPEPEPTPEQALGHQVTKSFSDEDDNEDGFVELDHSGLSNQDLSGF